MTAASRLANAATNKKPPEKVDVGAVSLGLKICPGFYTNEFQVVHGIKVYPVVIQIFVAPTMGRTLACRC